MSVEVGQAEPDQIVVVSAGETRQRAELSPALQRAALAFALTFAGLVLAVAAIGFGYHSLHNGKILPGVEVASVAVGGMDVAQAEAALRAELPSVSDGRLTVRVGDATETVSYAAISRDYDIELMLAQAVAVGRDGSIADELRALNHGAEVPVAIQWDNDALIRELDDIYAAAETAPVDATIARSGAEYVVTPSAAGQTFDRAQGYEAAISAVADPSLSSAVVSSAAQPVAPQVSTADAQAVVDRIESVVSASLTMSAADHSLTIPADVLRGWVRLVPEGLGEWSIAIDSGPIAQYVADLARVVNVAPTNASFEFQSGEAAVMPAVDGAAIDESAAVSAIVNSLESRADGTAAGSVNLALAPVAPEFSTAEAQGLVGRIDRLGRWTTHFKVSPRNGDGQNIRRPAKLINGYVVQPGAMFDFIDVAGPFTKRNGYTDGAAIQNGQTRLDGVLGGGLCSASTTLFNAALRAGFQIDERHNHSFYISRYPVGLDATIWQNGRIRKSMQFTNDSDYPILIRARYVPGRVTFEIWGVPDGRTVDFTKPLIENEKEAKNYVEYSDELPPGVFEHVEFIAPGFDSTVTRTVRDANGVVIHENTFYSDYIKVNGVYKVGRYPTDPRDGTRVLAADFIPTGPPQPEPEPEPEPEG